MRLVILALVVAACTPPSWERAKQRSPRQGVPIELFCTTDTECRAKQRGVVSVRGGDHVDYYALAIPTTACREDLRVELRWTVPREGSQLALSLWSMQGRYAMKRSRMREGGEPAKLAIETTIEGGGTYFVGVHAMDYIGAGEYTLDVVENQSACGPRWTPQGWQSLPDVYLPRPDGLATPPSTDSLVAITSAGMARQARDGIAANEPTFVLDAFDSRIASGSRGVLVDASGKRVPHSEFTVTGVFAPDASNAAVRFASARFVEPRWFRRRIETGWNLWFASVAKR